MRRIIVMVLHLFLKAPYYLFRVWLYGKKKTVNYPKAYAYVRRVCMAANRAGRVTIQAQGTEHLPHQNGYMIFPNHQGLYDVLSIIESCETPFAFVIKKEASNVILLKQVVDATGSLAIDREDIRQSMQVIKRVTEQIKEGRNFLIFAEGTRSRMGNRMNNMKGGSFKSATKARCPIVPVALVNSFVPFDEKSTKPVTVFVNYLEPICYEEYRDWNTTEIAAEVKRRIEAAIEQQLNSK